MKQVKAFEYDQDTFLRKYLELFSILYVDEENHLFEREKEFFIENVKLNAMGLSLVGKKAVEILKQKKFQVRSYRYNLKKKGWIIQTTEGIKLPKAFDFKNGNIPKDLTFNFKFKINETEN